MSPEQCQAARALLNLSRSKVAAKANCAITTLRNFELERHLFRSVTAVRSSVCLRARVLNSCSRQRY